MSEMHRGRDYGIYQLYGTHTVLGSDCLLYIGLSLDQPFGQRMRAHRDEWINWESNVVNIYVGRLGGTEPMTEDRFPEWNEQIKRAERLLIYFCAPPYNGQGLK